MMLTSLSRPGWSGNKAWTRATLGRGSGAVELGYVVGGGMDMEARVVAGSGEGKGGIVVGDIVWVGASRCSGAAVMAVS